MAEQTEAYMVYAGQYGSLADAQQDFQSIKRFHREKFIGQYDSALFTKQEGGKVKIIDTDETARAEGAIGGAIVGGVIGLMFPVFLIGLAAGTSALSAWMAHISVGMRRQDIKEMGEMLDEGQAGIMLIAETYGVDDPAQLMPGAAQTLKAGIKGDKTEMKAAFKQAA